MHVPATTAPVSKPTSSSATLTSSMQPRPRRSASVGEWCAGRPASRRCLCCSPTTVHSHDRRANAGSRVLNHRRTEPAVERLLRFRQDNPGHPNGVGVDGPYNGTTAHHERLRKERGKLAPSVRAEAAKGVVASVAAKTLGMHIKRVTLIAQENGFKFADSPWSTPATRCASGDDRHGLASIAPSAAPSLRSDHCDNGCSN